VIVPFAIFLYAKSEFVAHLSEVSAKVLVSPHPVFAENAKTTFPSRGRLGLVGDFRLVIEASLPDICAIPSDKIEEAKEAMCTRMKAFPLAALRLGNRWHRRSKASPMTDEEKSNTFAFLTSL